MPDVDVGACRPEFYLTAAETEQSRVLPCAPRSVAVARRLVAAVLDLWQLPQLTEAAVTVASELATNAIVHAKTHGASIRVAVSLIEVDRIQVAVTDLDRRQPILVEHSAPDEEGGRGLALVASLSENWGVDPRYLGKRVWVELAA
ncbi:ATP-binding protein [Streptomyces zaomyceticus]|uniref:ATP-binding protein n=1 Tax=Streptomyces zaomyceticus TaxID=68286 RepID=UPI00364D79F7